MTWPGDLGADLGADVPELAADGLLTGAPAEPAAPRPAPVPPVRATERHPYHADLDFLRDTGAKLTVNGSTGEPSSKRVLDAGRFGLEFFELFGPAYAEVTGNRTGLAELRGRYDAQREVGYQRLRVDAQRHQDVADALTEQILDLRNDIDPVLQTWQGQAAAEAGTRFAAFLARAELARAQFADLAAVLTAAVDAVDRALHAKATGVAELYTRRVGSLAAADLEFVIDFARRCARPEAGALIDDAEIRRVAGFCGLTVNPVLCRLDQELFGRLGADIVDWLRTVFVPFYQARLALFDELCRAADTVTGAAWAAVRTVLAEITGRPPGEDRPDDGSPAPTPFDGMFDEPVPAPAARQPAADDQPDEPPPPVVDDRPIPDTPAAHPGGISSALDG